MKKFRRRKTTQEDFYKSDDPEALALARSTEETINRRVETEVARTLRIVANFVPWEDAPGLRGQIIALADDRDPNISRRPITRARQSYIAGSRPKEENDS